MVISWLLILPHPYDSVINFICIPSSVKYYQQKEIWLTLDFGIMKPVHNSRFMRFAQRHGAIEFDEAVLLFHWVLWGLAKFWDFRPIKSNSRICWATINGYCNRICAVSTIISMYKNVKVS
jgi:hypothetical protein